MSAIYRYEVAGGAICVKRAYSGAESVEDVLASAILGILPGSMGLTHMSNSGILYEQNVCSPAEKENRI